jgi:hypothetical protein
MYSVNLKNTEQHAAQASTLRERIHPTKFYFNFGFNKSAAPLIGFRFQVSSKPPAVPDSSLTRNAGFSDEIP